VITHPGYFTIMVNSGHPSGEASARCDVDRRYALVHHAFTDNDGLGSPLATRS
jgi:hypothetical protein